MDGGGAASVTYRLVVLSAKTFIALLACSNAAQKNIENRPRITIAITRSRTPIRCFETTQAAASVAMAPPIPNPSALSQPIQLILYRYPKPTSAAIAASIRMIGPFPDRNGAADGARAACSSVSAPE